MDQMPDTLTSLSTCAVAHNTARVGLGGGIWASDANLEVDATLLEANQVPKGSGGGIVSTAQEDPTATTTTFLAPVAMSCTEVEVLPDWLQNRESCEVFSLATFGYQGTCDTHIISNCVGVYSAPYPFYPHNCSGCSCNNKLRTPGKMTTPHVMFVDYRDGVFFWRSCALLVPVSCVSASAF